MSSDRPQKLFPAVLKESSLRQRTSSSSKVPKGSVCKKTTVHKTTSTENAKKRVCKIRSDLSYAKTCPPTNHRNCFQQFWKSPVPDRELLPLKCPRVLFLKKTTVRRTLIISWNKNFHWKRNLLLSKVRICQKNVVVFPNQQYSGSLNEGWNSYLYFLG